MSNIRGSYQFSEGPDVQDQNPSGLVIPMDRSVVQSHVVDVDQPRQQGDFLDAGIDFKRIGRTVKYNIKSVIYEDEGEKLLQRINTNRPVIIGGTVPQCYQCYSSIVCFLNQQYCMLSTFQAHF